MEETEKFFIKNSKLRIENSLIDLFETEKEEDFQIKFNELKTYYTFLIRNNTISNSNKIIFFQLFTETPQIYLKNWLIDFFVTGIIKIYKNEINQNLLIDNDYFLFKLLSDKEKLRILINKHLTITFFNMNIFKNHIMFLPEAKTMLKDRSVIIDTVNDIIININKIIDINNNNVHTSDSFTIIYNIKKNFIENKEDKYIEIINNEYIFKNNEKNEIIINDKFKYFFYILLGLKVIDEKINLNTNDYKKIKKELDKIISLWPF
jgi:hypothetical protein